MNIKKFIAAVLMIAMMPSAIVAQNNAGKLPAQVKVYKPRVLMHDIIKESEIKKFVNSGKWGQDNAPADKKIWIVWSDREDNVTYNKPSASSGEYTKLSFNERLRIAEISNGFAHVYEEPLGNYVYPQISGKAKSKGWVKMEHLLLWDVCPSNEKSVTRKGLVGVNLAKANKNTKQLGQGYKNPNGDYKFALKNDVKFYFVMKEDRESDRCLLATSAKVSGGNTDHVLLGWVDESSFVRWEQSSCLEPNWDPEAVTYFRDRGESLKVYDDEAMSNEAGTMPYGQKNAEDSNPNTYFRMKKGALRYPILGKHPTVDDIYKITAYTDFSGDMANAEKAEDRKNAILEAVAGKTGRVNLIFVIDGTSSMKPYFESVVNAIKGGVSIFTADGKKREVRVGAVIYRDFPDGEYAFERRKLTSPKDATFLNWLQKGGEYGVHSVAKTETEAMYLGIHEALDAEKMGFANDESNLMLIVGDCGNDEKDQNNVSKKLTQANLLSKLKKYKFQIMSFQVHANDNNAAYVAFKDQINDLIAKNMDNLFANMKANAKSEVQISHKWRPVKGGFDLRITGASENDSKFYVGAVRSVANNVAMDANELTSLIQDRFGAYDKAVEAYMNIINNDNFVVDFEDTGLDESQRNEFNISQAMMKEKFSDEMWEAMRRAKMMVAVMGYTKKFSDGGKDFYKPVIFLSQPELTVLIQRMRPVVDAVKSGTEARDKYVDAMKTFVKSYVPGVSDDDIQKMSVESIGEVVSDLNVKNDALSKYTLDDLLQPAVVSSADFKKLQTNVQNKYQTLQGIQGNYKYKMVMNDQTYYWLPVEYLP